MSFKKLQSLVSIGQGALVLPFLDKKEGMYTVCDSVTARVVYSFDFQVCPFIIRSSFYPVYDDASRYKTVYVNNEVIYLVDERDKLWLYTIEYDLSGPYDLVKRGNSILVQSNFNNVDEDILLEFANTVKDFDSTITLFQEVFEKDIDIRFHHEQQLCSRVFPLHSFDAIPYYRTFLGYLNQRFPNLAGFPHYLYLLIHTKMDECLFELSQE
jgi:hypothetical protein